MKSQAYKLGSVTLFVAIAIILAALAFEFIGGYKPCPLCLQQRWAYYAGIPLLFAALVMISGDMPRLAALVFFAVSLAFLANAGLGVYHAGAEWKFWAGPATCAAAQPLSLDAANLVDAIQAAPVIPCDEPQWKFAGLSFAGWNVVISLFLFIASLKAAFAAAPKD